MSFDIWFQRFRGGEPAPISSSMVYQLFGPFIVHDGGSFIRVRFPDGSGADIWGKQRPAFSGLTFNHCGGEQFANAFFELLKRTEAVIYWPDGGCVVADPAVISQLPAFLTAQFGTPTVVHSGRQIFDRIAQT